MPKKHSIKKIITAFKPGTWYSFRFVGFNSKKNQAVLNYAGRQGRKSNKGTDFEIIKAEIEILMHISGLRLLRKKKL